MAKTVECFCHDPINKVGVHYHVVTTQQTKEKQNGN